MDTLPHVVSSEMIFVHVRIIVGMVLGISIARLVNGVMRYVQHPGREQIYPIHMGWVLFTFLFIVHFWWFEIALAALHQWSFSVYLFLICYAGIFAMLASLLFPDRIDEYGTLKAYFQQRRRWFFGILLAMIVLDSVDTFIKGTEYFSEHYNWDYPVRQGLLAIGTLGAMVWQSEKYQASFVVFAVVLQIAWSLSLF